MIVPHFPTTLPENLSNLNPFLTADKAAVMGWVGIIVMASHRAVAAPPPGPGKPAPRILGIFLDCITCSFPALDRLIEGRELQQPFGEGLQATPPT